MMENEKHPPRLAIVIPCYNEEAVLSTTVSVVKQLLENLIIQDKIAKNSFIYFIDDGSVDKTWEIIKNLNLHDHMIKGLKLSKNHGHQNALLAGLLQVKETVDCAISIDADLQDDVTVISKMIMHYRNGHDVVYGVRDSRATDGFLKRKTALLFYRLMEWSDSELIYNHADFRLLSQRALMALSRFEESALFLRGIVPKIGFSSEKVYYDRLRRVEGKSKYTPIKTLALAWNGLTSFSIIPLRIILIIGFLLFLISVVMIGCVIYDKIFLFTVPGWASIMIPIFLMGGVQLLSIGVIGEYLAKIFIEVKRRPRFIIDTEVV